MSPNTWLCFVGALGFFQGCRSKRFESVRPLSQGSCIAVGYTHLHPEGEGLESCLTAGSVVLECLGFELTASCPPLWKTWNARLRGTCLSALGGGRAVQLHQVENSDIMMHGMDHCKKTSCKLKICSRLGISTNIRLQNSLQRFSAKSMGRCSTSLC